MKKHGRSSSRSADPIADLESIIAHASYEAIAHKPDYQRVCIHIRSIRHRAVDADGVSAKAALDGIVKAGVLKDDNPQIVQEVSYSQLKTEGPEHTIITIRAV